MTSIPRGPETFEKLLEIAGLSDRESEAVRSVVLGMTAAEAAPLIGVGASTVGSYRQRAYQKLGVAGKSEFMRMPAVSAWADALAKKNEDSGSDGNEAQVEAAVSETKPEEAAADPSFSLPSLFARCVGLSIVVLAVAFAIWIVRPRPTYLSRPSGTVSTAYGEMPDVVGMRADAASEALAQVKVYPRFEGVENGSAPGTVVEVSGYSDAPGLGVGSSSFSWGEGGTAVFNAGGDWVASVVLKVAV